MKSFLELESLINCPDEQITLFQHSLTINKLNHNRQLFYLIIQKKKTLKYYPEMTESTLNCIKYQLNFFMDLLKRLKINSVHKTLIFFLMFN